MTLLAIACIKNVVTFVPSSTWCSPTNACKKPMQITTSNAKNIRLSFIMTFKITSIAPKNRKVSRYSRSRSQNIGALKARKL